MRKTILFIALITSALLLSSCDFFLEGLFPEATGGWDKEADANNTIEVGVDLDWTIYNSPEFQNCWAGIFIQLEIWDTESSTWREVDKRDRWCTPDQYFFETFEWLKPGEYRAIVYFDENSSWDVDSLEANTFAYDWNNGSAETVFIQGGNWYNLGAYLGSGSRDYTNPIP